MQNKSNIQLIREALMVKEAFENAVQKLTDNYLVEDSVFGFDGQNLNEITKGYMCIREEYKSLEEAFKNMNVGESLRIINNETFQIGSVSENLSNTDSTKIYSISFGQMVSE